MALRRLWLCNNDLSGLIPVELGALSLLTILNLSGNELAGRVPEELGQLYALEHLYLNDNALENHLPEALGTGCLALQTLEVHSNKLSGRIPQGFREGAAPALRRVTLGGNLFPASLAHDAAELQSVLPECNVLLELEE